MTRITRIRLGLGTFAVAAAMGLILWPVDAEAGRTYAVRGEPCSPVGAKLQNRAGTWYVCQQRKDDPCAVWHALHPIPGNWGSGPPAACPKCSLSPSASVDPSVTATTTHSSNPGPATSSTTAAPSATPQGSATSQPGGEDYNHHRNTLPVTGTAENVAALAAIVGALLILLGGAAIAITKPWRRYDT